ncbi:50S ribosomal protein L33 [Falsibacillus pallidus]|uniref:Large ribosomal subunit protein bL33 n=1 Tax=Falsibacillus pallidus TaxID=493781 RepID=A0A370G5J4_9BACI|nr:50S ribosomal protein L33 [Falsibacillus pallidus]RDI39025.1 LSU ribosomal protein L33P [Falsibacillus pallidus]
MSKKVVLACSVCSSRNYSTNHKAPSGDRLELRKFCKTCNDHTIHKETK